MRLTRPFWSIGLALVMLAGAPMAEANFSKPSISAPHVERSPPPSFTKPQLSAPHIERPPSSGFTKPPVAGLSAPAAPRSAADAAIAKGQSQRAYSAFQADQQRYRAPPAAAPQNAQAAQQTPAWRQYGSRWHSADAYYASRQSALQRAPASVRVYYEHPPAYIVAGHPSYGAYAAAFLGGVLLDRITQPSYAAWAYSHYSDPGFQAWRADMQSQAADNAELRDKLAQLDAQVAQLKAQNAPTTEALPEDVDPSLVVAPQTAMLATASSSHWWLWFSLILGLIVLGFFGACVMISQKR